MIDSTTHRRAETASGFAVRFFHTLVLVFSVAAGLATGLISLLPVVHASNAVSLPWAFWVSSLFLFLSSSLQQRAIQAVRLERQSPFRKRLGIALAAGIGFTAIQSYGLWSLWQNQPRTAEAASTGPEGFVFVLAVLHGLHVCIAIMFLTYVFLKSLQDRYDHEYYWGVTFCSWFWHALGIVWVGILVVFLIAT